MQKLYWKIIAVTKITLLINALLYLQKKGLRAFFYALTRRIYYTSTHLFLTYINRKKYKTQLLEILNRHPNADIIIAAPLLDWHVRLFQRPQHIAKKISEQGILYFYCTSNLQFDSVFGFEPVYEHCYLTDQFSLLLEVVKNATIHTYSTDLMMTYEQVENFMKMKHKILYEFIDDIHKDISGFIPEHALYKHMKILENEDIFVTATADKLYQEVLRHRRKNCALVTNGVNPEHYMLPRDSKNNIPADIKEIVEEGKPIIGYFGALATWVDYTLIKTCALAHPEWNFIFIGWDYDGSWQRANLTGYPNIFLRGPIMHNDLPLYARYFTICTIPFLINEITESTSPVKLFEYMSMKKPIVTTDMPECRKYQSVYIGKTHEEYIKKIEEALLMKDNQEYMQLLEQEAQENSWFNKAHQIVKLIHSS